MTYQAAVLAWFWCFPPACIALLNPKANSLEQLIEHHGFHPQKAEEGKDVLHSELTKRCTCHTVQTGASRLHIPTAVPSIFLAPPLLLRPLGMLV